ncbi:hypothetical protein [Nostoc sp. TCL240-02]|uniref:hypothetical protein n=1 Tax=Nostoc sp. TCL240-02 TaxID=2572090 RepID=UPI00157FB923|nr:hypothetical protein [Nostoc sp. TCL240-02]QKQ73066.1 hypothetical protein FBB35_06440 [Nostoc sp. TCL240-02]
MLETSERIIQKKSSFITLIVATITLSALIYYLVSTQWNIVELLHFCLGTALLWMPIGALFYLLLKRQVQEPIVRFTFSAIASYTVTTLIYFGLCLLRLELLFYIETITIFIGLIIYSIRKKFWFNIQIKSLTWRQFDWILALLIAVSLVVNIPYQKTWEYNPTTNTYKSMVCYECNYFTSLTYELARQVPPLQQSTRAGTPERSYHMFPHLTTMLLSRFTGQTDMLRVQVVYHYMIIAIGMCLALYSIVKTLTKSRVAAYLATATMYITAIPYRPLVKTNLYYFYFTLFPHVSSGIEPPILVSPQMYSGMFVAYGILLGILLICVRCYKKQPVGVALIITAIMIAATSRFRVHVFLPMLPGFLLLTAYGWKRTRQKAYLVAAGLAVALSFLICLETQSSYYLSGTASFKLGFNGLTEPSSDSYFNSWPFSSNIYDFLSRLIHNSTVFKWVWQVVSMCAFVILNMIGIPLFIITNIYLSSKLVRQKYLLFTSLIVWMTVVSTLGGICLTTDYDSYSLGGQLLETTSCYPFLLMIPGLYQVYKFFQPHLSLTRATQISLVAAFVVISLVAQQLSRPSVLMASVYSYRATTSASERMALAYIHDNTPQKSVILTDKYANYGEDYPPLISGIAGRAAYLEFPDAPANELASKLYPSDNRQQVIKDLWATSQAERFCRLLTATSATHIIEYSTHPLLINNPPCMQSIWESSKKVIPASSEKVTIWKINL